MGKSTPSPGVADLDLVQSLCFSPDSRRLASGGYRTVRIWQKTGEPQRGSLQCADRAATAIAVSRDGLRIAVGHADGQIELCDAANGSVFATLRGHRGAVSGVAWSRDNTACASVSADQTLRMWNVAASEATSVVSLSTPATVVALIENPALVAAGGPDGIVRIWEFPVASPATTPGEVAPPQTPGSAASAATGPRELRGHAGPITALECLTSGPSLLVSGSQDGTLRVWDVANGKPTQQMKHGGPITALAVRPDGKRIASASSDGTTRLWDPANARQVAELRGDFRATLHVSDMTRAVAVARRLIEAAKADLQAARDRKTAEEANAQAASDAVRKAEEELAKKVEASKQPVAARQAAEKSFEEAQAALQQAAPADQKAAQEKVTAAEKDAKKAAEAAAKAVEEQSLAEHAVQAARRAVERAGEQVKNAGDAIPQFETQVAQAESQAQETEARLNSAEKSKPRASNRFSLWPSRRTT